MAYSVQADVENACGGLKRLKQLFDWDNDAAVDAARITDCIAEADALIDSFAAKLFTVPFNPVPEIIKRTSAQLAKLIGSRRRRPFTNEEQIQWDGIAGTEQGKEGWLLKLATGVVTPGTDPMPTKHGTMADAGVETSLPTDRDQSRDKLGGFW